MATGGSDKDATGEAGDDTEAGKLMCAICLERYRRPKLLPCFHTFCQSCLQGVAGSAPSLTCPSCRTFVMLPPGGVRALQTNFYIEEDLAGPTSPSQQRLCDVCTEDREATHVCFQCRQRLCSPCQTFHDALNGCRGHTVVSLTQEEGSEKGGAAALVEGPKEEMCPKHPSQSLLLHCKQCQGDICIQCKLTQHEGHPTEDLADTRSKARTTLEQLLEDVTQQRQQILHLVLALKDRCVQVKSQKQETEQSFRSRADTLFQWVNQSLDEAVTNLEKSAQGVEKAFQDQVELLEKKDAALQAQQVYAMRVLKEGSGGDLVPLEDQLSSSRSESDYFKQVEKELSKGLSPFWVQQDTSALGQKEVREFVGAMRPFQPTPFPLQDSAPVCTAKSSVDSSVSKNKKKKRKPIVYSKNSESSIVAMCPISQSRLWVAYTPGSDAAVILKLFDADGQVLSTVNGVVLCGLVALSDDTILACSGFNMFVNVITPAGERSCHGLEKYIYKLIPSPGNDKCYYTPDDYSVDRNTLQEVQVSKAGKVTFSKTGLWHFTTPAGLSQKHEICCRHVSYKGEYVAAIDGHLVRVFTASVQQNSALFATYTPDKNTRSLDVRFCFFGGQEQLLVAVQGHYGICVVDHTDGCRFIRHLETDYGLSMTLPELLATNFDQNVWVGYKGGKVEMFDL